MNLAAKHPSISAWALRRPCIFSAWEVSGHELCVNIVLMLAVRNEDHAVHRAMVCVKPASYGSKSHVCC